MPRFLGQVGPRSVSGSARSLGLAFVILFVAFATAVAQAAEPVGTITGLAKDALARPLAAAQLRLETSDGQVLARTTADGDGRFAFTGVAPGTYVVVAEQAGFDTATAVVTVSADAGATAELTLASQEALDLSVVEKRLEEARISIQPRIGASTYDITDRAIQAQPRSENNPLNQVLLQAPGVAQDSFGQIHVRNEHANVQYRINGVLLPEGVSFFGQSLSPRFASSIDLITGALPAQYGLRTAGIVDIQTKTGGFGQGGSVGLYGGSHDWLQPSAEYRGSVGRFTYFVTGDYLQNGIGIESATPGDPIHDNTAQGHGFGYFEYILDSTSKVSATLGGFLGHFQIPNRPGQTPMFTVLGASTFDSTRLNETQNETNYYGVLSYLKATGDFTVQVSGFVRSSGVTFHPDLLGDLLFNGIAPRAERNNLAGGIQAEGSYKLTPTHTVRAGVILEVEQARVPTTSTVLPASGGMQTSDVPLTIVDNTSKTGYVYSLYLQDEWRILPTVTINGGLRFDAVEEFTHDNQLNPRLNVVWTPTPTTTIHAGYARYFTPPPLELVSTPTISKFANTTAEPPVKLNSPVKAESAHYVDVGIAQQLVPGFTVGFDAYYKYAQNLIDEGQFGAPVVQTAFNYQHGQNVGVELTAAYAVGNVSVYGNLAIAQQKAKKIVSAQTLFSADDLAFIAGHDIHTDHDQFLTASGGAAYVWNRTRVSLDFLAGSGLRRTVTTPNDSTVPAYQQVNLSLVHRFSLPTLGGFEARFDVINLLDQTYEIRDGTGVGVFSPQFGPRRAFFLGLKKEF